jgi:hypothetical protein
MNQTRKIIDVIFFIINSLFFGYLAIFAVWIMLDAEFTPLKWVCLTGIAIALGSAMIISDERFRKEGSNDTRK